MLDKIAQYPIQKHSVSLIYVEFTRAPFPSNPAEIASLYFVDSLHTEL